MISSKQESFFHQELALNSKMSMPTTVFSCSVTRVVASSMISLERLRKISAHRASIAQSPSCKFLYMMTHI